MRASQGCLMGRSFPIHGVVPRLKTCAVSEVHIKKLPGLPGKFVGAVLEAMGGGSCRSHRRSLFALWACLGGIGRPQGGPRPSSWPLGGSEGPWHVFGPVLWRRKPKRRAFVPLREILEQSPGISCEEKEEVKNKNKKEEQQNSPFPDHALVARASF